MSTDEQGTPRVRTSDAEREYVAEMLRTAVSDGRLSLEEGDERLAALYATKFRDELAPLIADLPNDAPDAGQAGRGRGSRGRSGPAGHGPGFAGPPWAQPGQAQSGQGGPWPGQSGHGQPGQGGPGQSQPGQGQPGSPWSGPGQPEGSDQAWGQAGPPWAQSGPQWGGPAHPWAYRRCAPWRGLRFVVTLAALIGILAISHVHFFWLLIPLTFLTLGLFRFAAHRLHRHGRR